MKRQIVLDTETTGIGHEQGHKIIEIGCVELIDRKLTGKHFHVYLNPQRMVDEGAFRVHGISSEFLMDKPLFNQIVSDFMQFIEGSELIIHNAPFDIGFLNSELSSIKYGKKIDNFCEVIDTLVLARELHPGQRNSLDALCKRYEVDNSNRQKHGALLDAEILALVYLAMTGGQSNFFTNMDNFSKNEEMNVEAKQALYLSNPVVLNPSDEEIEKHEELVSFIKEKSGINYWEE